jgi:hypothetical protein
MKGADEDLSKDFRERSYAQARRIIDARRRLLSSDYGAMTLFDNFDRQ